MHPTHVYDYLTRARTTVFGWVRPLSDEQYRLEHPIGLGSLARTLHHMRAAEWQYMHRLRGERGPITQRAPADDPEVSTEDALSFVELESAWRDLTDQTRRDLAAVTDWDAEQVFTTEWEGRPYAYRAAPNDVFVQLLLHEVHHRAQVLHMLRRLDVATEDLDYSALMWPAVDVP